MSMFTVKLDVAPPNPLEDVFGSTTTGIIVLCGVAVVLTVVISIILFKKKNKKATEGKTDEEN